MTNNTPSKKYLKPEFQGTCQSCGSEKIKLLSTIAKCKQCGQEHRRDPAPHII